MSFRLRTIDFTADHRRIVREKPIDAPRLTVGRAAENTIHLPDLAVEPQHAAIEERADGRLSVTALGSLGFTLDGKAMRQAGIDPATGGELRFGSSRISVTRAEDGATLLTVQAIGEDSEAEKDHAERNGFALSSVLPGKRWMAWALAALVALAFLAVPVFTNLTRHPDPKQAPNTSSGVINDDSWSPGALSLAHHSLEKNCVACHVKPFESVRDTACISCHKDVHDHAPANRIALARALPSPFDQLLWKVAHAFNKPGPGACVDCHREHDGPTRMELPSQQFCADCHGTLKDRVKDTALGNAADFGTSHPEFTPSVVVDPVAKRFQTVSLDANPRENNGLTFMHKTHLAPAGGVAKMASTLAAEKGYGANGLACADCHHPSEDGIRFKPINMQRDCEACHSLVYDKVGPTFRKLRHGDVAQMIADLSVARPTASLVTGRARPGEFASSGLYHANFAAPVGPQGMLQRAMAKDGVCGECHTPMMKAGKPGVVPVVLTQRYMANGWFNHATHKQTKCVECHAAPASTTSADVLLPNVKECRSCHLGEDAHKAKVPSSCALCHSYHQAIGAPPFTLKAKR